MSDKPDNPYIDKDADGNHIITPEGQKYLEKILTNATGQVYSITEHADPLMMAAGMARLSRRFDDMRITMLDEFATQPKEKMEGLFKRVITAYGDDSVQQLMPIFLVVESASRLLAKQLEWGRLAAYLEQSSRYIFYDRKYDGKYRYYRPTSFSPELLKEYEETCDFLFDTYSKIVHTITDQVRNDIPEPENKAERIAWLGATRAQGCDAARCVLPLGMTATVGIMGSAQAIDNMIMNLASLPFKEAQDAAGDILTEVRKVSPVFFERTDLPERGGATVAYRAANRAATKAIADQYLPRKKEEKPFGAELISYWPQNEFDLVPHMLFEQSGLTMSELRNHCAGWDEARKREVFKAYIGERMNRRHKPGRAIEYAHYEWELTLDYASYYDLQRHRMLDMPEWQAVTPYYGFELPDLVVKQGFTEDVEKCRERSKQMYEKILAAGHEYEAQYVVLNGNRIRFHFVENARQAFHMHELRTTPQGHPLYRKIVKQMHDRLSDVHPIIGEAIKFVNKDEDPELTRMAGEMATQAKLALLDTKEAEKESAPVTPPKKEKATKPAKKTESKSKKETKHIEAPKHKLLDKGDPLTMFKNNEW